MAKRPAFQPSSVETAYRDAVEQLGGRATKKIAHNTYLVHEPLARAPDQSEARVTYHGHTVIIYRANGTITLNAHGYRTYTTKERFNWFLPPGYSVAQEQFEWFVYGPHHWRKRFEDGMVLGGGLLAIANPAGQRALWIGALVVAAAATVGVVAYASSSKASAAPPSGISVPTQIVQGHRYKSTVIAPTDTPFAFQDVAAAQAFVDKNPDFQGKIKVVSVSVTTSGDKQTGIIEADYTGPTMTVPPVPPDFNAQLASMGLSILVVDEGQSVKAA